MKLSKWPLWDDDGEMLQKKFLLLILLSQTSSLPYDDVRGFLFFPRTFTKCVYTRVPPRFVVWTSSGRNLLFEFYFTKSIRKLEPMWQKTGSSCYDIKYVQTFLRSIWNLMIYLDNETNKKGFLFCYVDHKCSFQGIRDWSLPKMHKRTLVSYATDRCRYFMRQRPIKWRW